MENHIVFKIKKHGAAIRDVSRELASYLFHFWKGRFPVVETLLLKLQRLEKPTELVNKPA